MNYVDYPNGVTKPIAIAPGIYREDKMHWAMNSYAGLGVSEVNGDSSGCIYRRLSEREGLKLCLVPKVAIYRHYWSSKGKISCFLSYPNGMGMLDDFFWEVYSLEGDLFDDIERFDTEEECEAWIINKLKEE